MPMCCATSTAASVARSHLTRGSSSPATSGSATRCDSYESRPLRHLHPPEADPQHARVDVLDVRAFEGRARALSEVPARAGDGLPGLRAPAGRYSAGCVSPGRVVTVPSSATPVRGATFDTLPLHSFAIGSDPSAGTAMASPSSPAATR